MSNPQKLRKTLYQELCREARSPDTLLKAIKSADFAIVPKEPTEEMLQKMQSVINDPPPRTCDETADARACWEFALELAPKLT